MSEAIVETVALSIIRQLSGSPGYPPYEEGERRAARLLAECCVSVDHARAVVAEFETDFPMMEQVRACAFRLKERFEPRRPEPERPGAADGAFTPNILQKMQADMDQHWRDDKEMWAKIKAHLKVAEFSRVEFVEIAQAKKDLGYELTADDVERLRLRDSL